MSRSVPTVGVAKVETPSTKMSVKIYEATWGLRVWLISVCVTLFLAAIPGLVFAFSSGREAVTGATLSGALIGLTVGITALFVVRRFELGRGVLRVRRSFWRTEIDLADLKEVELDPQALRGAWRMFGNDGLFAIHGWFWSKRLGKCRAFITDPKNSVVLRFTNPNTNMKNLIVISPDNPCSFVREMRRQLEQTHSHPHAR